jgi:hypothetical protein
MSKRLLLVLFRDFLDSRFRGNDTVRRFRGNDTSKVFSNSVLFLGVFLISLIMSLPVFACVGARPLAMGGAFIGVADDANATYWNPAGLTQIEDVEFTYTPTLYDRDTVNYDDFVSFVTPLKIERYNMGNLGVSFVNSGTKSVDDETSDRWYGVSYGKEIFSGLSLGLNLRQERYEWEIKKGYYIEGTTVIGPIEDSDKDIGADLALFYKLDKLSMGVLYQNINEPEFNLFDGRYRAKAVRNLRPGIAFRPDDKTIISAELYDITGETSSAEGNLRLGVERWFDLPHEGTSLALRWGGYNVNADDKDNRALTGGIGLKWDNEILGSREKSYPFSVSLDYAVMGWADLDHYTHFLGFTVTVPFESFDESAKTGYKQKNSRWVSNNFDKQITASSEQTEVKAVSIVEQLIQEEEMTPLKKKKIQYYVNVYEKLQEYLANKIIPVKGKAQVFFTVREDGRLKDIAVNSPEYGLKEIVEEALSEITYFPQIPQDLKDREIDFALDVTIG